MIRLLRYQLPVSPANYRPHQEGVVLFIALVVLVAMTMSGLALMRSTDTANVIAGNVAFKQAALQEADVGIEAAFLALSDPLAVGYIPNKNATATPRYYALMETPATNLRSSGMPASVHEMKADDAVDADADLYATANDGVGPSGNRVRYVIERLCGPVPATGEPPATPDEVLSNCLVYTPASVSNSSQNSGRIKLNPISLTTVYYRVTVRVDGPRNTLSITQATLRI